MIYITGDTHGEFERFEKFCFENKVSRDDIMIILGDVGLNYWENSDDSDNKRYAENFGMTFFCIHGNHEKRPFGGSAGEYQADERAGVARQSWRVSGR